MSIALEPYCGPAPDAQTLFYSWNFDPTLIVASIFGLFLLHRGRGGERVRLTPLIAIVLFVAFISPLCALTSALFSARVVHHILVGSVMSVMIALMLPNRIPVIEKVPAEAVFLFHTVIYWLWYMPASYSFALSGSWQYWLMQIALIVASVWLWWIIFAARTSAFSSMFLTIGTMLQMGFLAAILVFAQYPLFEAHFLQTQAFGLSPLED